MVWNAGMQLYPWLIAALAGTLEVAVWGACYQLAAVANPLLMGLQNFIGPRIAEAFTERDRTSFCSYVYKTALGTSLLMIGPAIVLCIFADAALRWLTHGTFTGHQMAITFLCAAIVIQSTTFTLSRGLFALHRADLDLYCNFGPLLLLFTGGTALTWHMGATGAALSMLIAQVLSASSRAILFARAARESINEPTKLSPMPQLRGAA
jgi:O-antigen/teichoic acid export membrane protein